MYGRRMAAAEEVDSRLLFDVTNAAKSADVMRGLRYVVPCLQLNERASRWRLGGCLCSQGFGMKSLPDNQILHRAQVEDILFYDDDVVSAQWVDHVIEHGGEFPDVLVRCEGVTTVKAWIGNLVNRYKSPDSSPGS